MGARDAVARSRRGARRAVAVAALAAVWTGCDSGDPILSAGGHGRDFRIAPEDAAVLVGAPGARTPDRVAVRVSALPGGDLAATGREVRFRVEAGEGRLVQGSGSTDADGVASVGYVPAAVADSTVVRAFVADDPGAAILVRVLARPAVTLDGEPGAVLAVPGASAGVLLAVPAGATVDLVPHSTSPSRGGLRYLLRRDRGTLLELDGPAGAAPALVPARAAASPSLLLADPIPAGATPLLAAPASAEVRPQGGGGLPPALDIANCQLDVHRLAPLARAGRTLALYVDADEPPDPGRLDEVLGTFDERVAPLLDGLFGPPVDLDGNGRVLAVMTRSMRPDGGVYCGSVRHGREVLYMAWDPASPSSQQLQVLAHEYQHVLNASQHFRHDPSGRDSDLPWLNEGLSHVAEWKADYPAGDLIRTFVFLGRVNAALPLLAERDGSDFAAGRFLFALYLGDRFGDGIYRALGESGLVGRDNVERVTGIPFRDLLRDWFVTLALGDRPPAEPAWRYRSIELAGEEARAAACGCLPSPRLPGVTFEPIPVGVDVALARTLDVQDADFFRVAAADRPALLYFQAGGEPDVELFAVRR